MKGLDTIFIPKRLRERMKCIYTEKFTVMSLSAGKGKSATVREYIRRTRPDGCSVRFITDLPDDDSCFREYCRLVLGKEYPMPVTQEEYYHMLHLFRDAKPTKQTVIVFDSPTAHKMLLRNLYCTQLFLKYAPTNTVLLCTELSDILVQMMEKHDIPYIRGDEFHLTAEETKQYIRRCNINVDPTLIHRMTGGQVIPTRLALMTLAQGKDISGWRTDELVESALFSGQPKAALLAGICAAAFQRLDKAIFSDLAEYPVLEEYFGAGSTSPEEIIYHINDINSKIGFITISGKECTLKTNYLFKTAMYQHFLQLPEKVRQALNRCSAAEYSRAGMSFRSFCQYYLAGDYYAAADSAHVEQVPFPLLLKSKQLLYKFVMECPLDCTPILPHLIRSLALLMLTTYKDRAAHRFDDIIKYIQNTQNLTEDGRRRLLSYAFTFQTYKDYYRLDRMGNHIKRAYDLYDGNPFPFPPNYSWALYSPSVFCLIHSFSINLATEAEQFSRYQRMYTEMINHGEMVYRLYAAELRYYLGDMEDGIRHSAKIIRECTDEKHIPPKIIALSVGARCALLSGNYEIFTLWTKDLAHIIRKYACTENGEAASIALSMISCMKKGTDADIWPSSSTPGEYVLLNRYTAPFYFFIRAFAILSHKQYRILLEKKEYYLQAARDVNNETVYLMLTMAAAIAHFMENETETAAELLREVLDALAPSQMIMPAVEICIHFPQLFTFARETLPSHYQTLIRRILEESVPFRQNIETLRTRELTEINRRANSNNTASELAEAEAKQLLNKYKAKGVTLIGMKYAVLASQGRSNTEIADICRATENSVKSSLKRTFAALGIRSRGQLRHILGDTNN